MNKHFFIFILVTTILETGVNYHNTSLIISRKHPGHVLFLTKRCCCLPASTVSLSADYFHFRQMAHWQSRSNLKLCYQAVFTQRSNLNIGILSNFPGHSCLPLTSASASASSYSFFFWAASFLFFFLAISRLSFVGLCSCLLSLDQVSSLNGVAIHITLWAVKSAFLLKLLNIKCHLINDEKNLHFSTTFPLLKTS